MEYFSYQQVIFVFFCNHPFHPTKDFSAGWLRRTLDEPSELSIEILVGLKGSLYTMAYEIIPKYIRARKMSSPFSSILNHPIGYHLYIPLIKILLKIYLAFWGGGKRCYRSHLTETTKNNHWNQVTFQLQRLSQDQMHRFS